MKSPHLLLLLALIAACAPVTTTPPPSDARGEVVSLSAERLAADRVRLILQNGSESPVGYNLCTSALQYLTGTTWQPVETGEVCTMELRTLNPGFDATFEKTLPASLPHGQYRYVTSVEMPVGTPQVRVTTAPFEVR
jgi:hypothetical protein